MEFPCMFYLPAWSFWTLTMCTYTQPFWHVCNHPTCCLLCQVTTSSMVTFTFLKFSAGTSSITVNAVAATPGTFVMPPIKAFAPMQPEVCRHLPTQKQECGWGVDVNVCAICFSPVCWHRESCAHLIHLYLCVAAVIYVVICWLEWMCGCMFWSLRGHTCLSWNHIFWCQVCLLAGLTLISGAKTYTSSYGETWDPRWIYVMAEY